MRKILKNTFRAVPFLAILLLMSACRSKSEVTYLQDLQPNVTMRIQSPRPITFRPGDRLGVNIQSRDREVSSIFNLQGSSVQSTDRTDNSGGTVSHSASGINLNYTVDRDSTIELPVVGKVKVGGLTRLEVARNIQNMLKSRGLLADPTVTVDYGNLGISVTGEVNRPGRLAIDRDEITLLEAIALAGDLTIQGRRDNILVLRTENGLQTPYRVDLTKTKSLYSSPVYYLQQNDVIYVEPTPYRANESKQGANVVRNPTFWVSIASVLASIVSILLR